MDRERGARSIRLGLWAGALSLLVFGATFYAAILYID